MMCLNDILELLKMNVWIHFTISAKIGFKSTNHGFYLEVIAKIAFTCDSFDISLFILRNISSYISSMYSILCLTLTRFTSIFFIRFLKL